jgi:hypothetical protein
MTVADLSDYLIGLERKKFTGQVILNYYNGSISAKVDKKVTDVISPQQYAGMENGAMSLKN